jgi:iron complex transport system substrate-binding protein
MRRGWPVLLLMLAGCASQPAIVPGQIVSANPCIDAILADVAAPGQIGGVSAFSHDPASASAPLDWARRYPAVGMSAEEIVAAHPRLLLTGNLGSGSSIAAIRKASIRALTFGVPATVAESQQQISAIARAIGREAEGLRLNARIAQAIAPRPAGPSPTAIIWQAGGFVAGTGTIQDEMLSLAGYRNASSVYGLNQWEQLPLETLVRNPPDIIFMADTAEGDAARALAMKQRLLAKMGARTKVVRFPDRLLFCAGPTIVETMARLRAARVSS